MATSLQCLRAGVIVVLCQFVTACTTPPLAPAEGRVEHVVLCWLGEPGNRDHQRRIIEASKQFRGMAGVLKVSTGRVLPSDRNIVDDSFDVGIVITFASVEDMRRYLVHPVHVATVRDIIRPLTSRILVYDFVIE
jgi:hypothetical protein